MGSLTPELLEVRPPFINEPVASTKWSARMSWSGKFLASTLTTRLPAIFPFFTILPSRNVPPFWTKSLRRLDSSLVPAMLGGRVETSFTGALMCCLIFCAVSSPSRPKTAGSTTTCASPMLERTLRASSLSTPSFCMSLATAVDRITLGLLVSLSTVPSFISHRLLSAPACLNASLTKLAGKSRNPLMLTTAILSQGSEAGLSAVT